MLARARRLAFEAYRRMEVRRHSLLYLFMEITRRCNLSCLHCGSDCGRGTVANELTTASWLKIIDDVRDGFGPNVAIVLTGGEPLLHPDLNEIGGHIASHGMRWGIVTNGQMLGESRFNALMKNDINSITVSLDGPKDQHDRLRNQAGAFEKTLDALNRIGSSDIPMSDVVTCVHPGNIDHLDETAEIILKTGLPAWRLFRIFPSGRAGRDQNLNLSFDQTWRMLNWIEENRPRLAERGLKMGASCEGYLPFDVDRRVRDVPFFCRAGVNFGAILSDGSVTGCSNNDPSFSQGNVLENNFRYIWENRFESFRRREWIEKTSCADCPELKHCQGGSIHLWKLGEDSPCFCYCRDVEEGEG